MSLQVFCFSPTGGTRRVAEAAAAIWGGARKWFDLGRRSFPVGLSVDPGADCIIAVPCFSGRVPPVAASRIASLRGNGARTMVLAVFGSRAYGDSLLELTDLAEAAGFHVVGAGAVAAQHSLAPKIGAGRPDSKDLTEVADFARRVKASGSTGSAGPAGHRPYRPYNRLGYAPAANQDCRSCTICADVCPTDAIYRRRGMPADVSKCIGCMTCVKQCPRRCRHLPEEVSREIAAKLAAAVPARARNEFFLAD